MAVQDFSKCPEDKRHKCEIFHCDSRRDRYCCFYCQRKGICRNPCLNNPERCGKAFEEDKKNGK